MPGPDRLGRRMTAWPGEWAIVRLPGDAAVPVWALEPAPLHAVVRTSAELSLVLPDARVPDGVQAERGFRVLAVEGPLPFAETGVMAAIASPLSKAGISLFAVSTYDTDYVLVKGADLALAIAALEARGWSISAARA